ncbi:GNAT family N-acetyltransferase [Streptomyces sp. H27-D2]|uniref:GNAT family N-acetyltransferase n=1 Tax=Streptomyces sp. H27-D2 TaxID=3046304 RepID=UPI002DB84BD9|nr:GNAT family protein [Streptomyces sp. H27-D2]MEC4016955.1 GNAT family protein [Streptomyces sp. H27-D2]
MPTDPADAYLATGTRVAIRHFRRQDREEFTRRARESVRLHHPWLFPPTDAGGFGAYVSKLEEPSREGFVIVELETGGLAGFISLSNIVQGAFQCGSMGYGAFAHAAGRGLFGEGFGLVLRYAFGELGLHRLEVNIQPANESSVKVAKRHGFRLEGYSPDFLHIDGAWRDHERWALTSDMPGAAGSGAAGDAASR